MSQPLTETVAFKVLLWLLDNPDESLTARDMGVKFSLASCGDMHGRLKPLMDAGLIAAEGHGKANPKCYMAGPELRRRVLASAAQMLDAR